jgi:hypothetical protein
MRRLLIIIIASLFFGIGGTPSLEAGSKVSKKMERLIWRVAHQERIDPYLLWSVVAIESAFKSRIVSHRGAVGLMQLMPATARELGVTNRFNPEQNLRGGARYLKKMIRRFSSIRLALAAYNAGPANVNRFKGIPPFAETQKYVGNVLRYYSKINPGSNSLPRKSGRSKKPNGTLTLTDTRQIYTLSVDRDISGQRRLFKRTPLLSIERRFSNRLKTARMAPDIPAKRRIKSTTKTRTDRVSIPKKPSTPVIQLASLISSQMQPKGQGRTLLAVREIINEVPIIRLSRQ